MALVQQTNVAGMGCPGAVSGVLWPLLLPHCLFKLIQKTWTYTPLLFFTNGPFLKLPCFFFQRRPTLSVGFSPATF